MRTLLRVLASIAGAVGISAVSSASAQPAAAGEYPERPIRIIVPWPAGGLVDIVARNVGQQVSLALGQPVVVENKPGAGGSIGAEAVAQAQPDGYTLLVSTSALNMNAALGTRTSFDVRNDFSPIALAAFAPNILVVHPSLPVHSVTELVELLKKEPGKRTYASAGTGSPAHFSAELFGSMAGVNAVHVPYKGAPAAMLDQIAGRIDFHFANAAVALPQIRSNKVRAIAITSARRADSLPDLPTMAESGVSGFEADQWIGMLAPAGTPAAIIGKLSAAVDKALADETVHSTLARNGMVVHRESTPGSFAGYLRKDYEKWAALAEKARLKIE